MKIIILIALIVLGGVFAAAEVALISISPIRVRAYVKQGRKGALALQRLKDRPRRMITFLLICTTIVNIAAASLATIIAGETFGSGSLGIAAGALTLVMLIFAELVPKTFAATYASQIALAFAAPLEVLLFVLMPAVLLLELLSRKMTAFVRLKHEPLTETEIKAMIEYGVEKKLIEPDEKFIMQSAFKLSDVRVHEIMTPLPKVFALDAALPVGEALDKMTRRRFSRVPVYAGQKESITGIVLLKDVVRASKEKQAALKDIARKPIVVQKDMLIGNLFKLFQAKQTHIACAKDGEKIIGIVTLEDILEELVGEIRDESEEAPGAQPA